MFGPEAFTALTGAPWREPAVIMTEQIAAATALRLYAKKAWQLMETERLALSHLHAVERAGIGQCLRNITDPRVREEAATSWKRTDVRLSYMTAAAMVAAGWPITDESVLVTVENDNYSYSGLATYLGINNQHRTEVFVRTQSDAKRKSNLAFIPWGTRPTYPNKSEPGDPNESIAMRLAAAPDHVLPVPYPKYPDAEDLGLTTEPIGLFEATTEPLTKSRPTPRSRPVTAPTTSKQTSSDTLF